MKIHTNETSSYECLICGRNMTSYAALIKHIDQFHFKEKLKTKCICDLCGEFYYSKQRLENHMKLKHRYLGYRCLDKVCSKNFTDFYTRRRHYLTHHNSDREVSLSVFILFVNFYFKTLILEITASRRTRT